jgi:hypothetical protein
MVLKVYELQTLAYPSGTKDVLNTLSLKEILKWCHSRG